MTVSSAHRHIQHQIDTTRMTFSTNLEGADLYLAATRFDQDKLVPGEIVHIVKAGDVGRSLALGLQKNSDWSGRGSKALRAPLLRNPPGGKSSLEMHEHDHGIYILRGKTSVLLGMNIWRRVLGTLFTSPHERHQLKSVGEDPLWIL